MYEFSLYARYSKLFSIFVIDRSTSRKERESYEGAQSAGPPTFRAGDPASFIYYLLYAINTLGYPLFCFRITSQILLLFVPTLRYLTCTVSI